MYPRQPTAGNEPPGRPHPPSTAASTSPAPSAVNPSTGGGYRSRSPGPAANGSAAFGTRLRLTVAEMNYATRRMVELQGPWIAEDRPR